MKALAARSIVRSRSGFIVMLIGMLVSGIAFVRARQNGRLIAEPEEIAEKHRHQQGRRAQAMARWVLETSMNSEVWDKGKRGRKVTMDTTRVHEPNMRCGSPDQRDAQLERRTSASHAFGDQRSDFAGEQGGKTTAV